MNTDVVPEARLCSLCHPYSGGSPGSQGDAGGEEGRVSK